MKRWNRTRKWG